MTVGSQPVPEDPRTETWVALGQKGERGGARQGVQGMERREGIRSPGSFRAGFLLPVPLI